MFRNETKCSETSFQLWSVLTFSECFNAPEKSLDNLKRVVAHWSDVKCSGAYFDAR
jgi:hypothetical protein